jgi:hypothetical protein
MTAGATRPAGVPEVGTFQLLVALLGAPLVWAIHLGLSYFLVAVDCGSGWDGARTGIVIATIASTVAALAAGWFAWRLWKRLRAQNAPGTAFDPPQTNEFLVLSGAMLAPLFAGVIVLAGISPFFVALCN